MPARFTISARITLYITIEARLSATLPIARLVVVGSRARAHQTEKYVLGWLDDDAHVSSPNYQISWLRLLDALKVFDAGVKVRRRRIVIWQAGLFVYGMDKVRTIAVGTALHSGVKRSREH